MTKRNSTLFLSVMAGFCGFGSSFALSATTPSKLLPLFGQCNTHIPEAGTADDTPLDQQRITIEAGEMRGQLNVEASFENGVNLTQGDRHLEAERAVINQQTHTLTADGKINFKNTDITINSEHLKADLNSHQASLDNAQYQLHGLQGRGEAQNLQISSEQELSLEKAVYTGCPPGDKSWSINAESIQVNQEEEWAVARNATVRILDVPVLYLPYISYPISDKRRSGLLFPSISSSTSNGLDISAPIYWNIAPEYDATFTPRVMSYRGLQLQSEFRYLSAAQRGQINVDHINYDEQADEARSMVYWTHDGTFNRYWQLETDYTWVSDDSYLSDLGSSIASSSETELTQRGKVSYNQDNWYVGLTVNDFQVLDDSEAPHQLLPQLNFTGSWPTGYGGLEYSLDSEFSNFGHEDDDQYKAERYHLEPSLKLPLNYKSGYIDSELALMHTIYRQDTQDYSDLDENVTRALPKFRLLTGVNFDRESRWFGLPYHQTLEPKFQYLYIPYKDQSNIGIYDTDVLQQDFHSLFRDVRFAGLDRIADANQLSLGATSRFIDSQGDERLRVAAGHTIYLNDSKVTLDDDDDEVTSAFTFELDANLNDNWFFHAGMQTDTDNNELDNANAALEWQPSSTKLIQLNYRYVVESDSMVSKINQAGAKMSWPITSNVNFVGSYYHDLELSRAIDQYAGIQFNACCWSVRLTYQRQLTTDYLSDGSLNDTGAFDSSLQLQFEIKGVGGVNTIGNQEMLDAGPLNYGRPFYLNN